LTQGHYLSRDVLLSLSTSDCISAYGTCNTGGSVLDNIVAQDDIAHRQNLIRGTVGPMVPTQFGYLMEMSNDQGNSWSVLYDTASDDEDPHAKRSKKLTVATQVMTFGYSARIYKLLTSPYTYTTCNGNGIFDPYGSTSSGTGGSSRTINFGLITCGQISREVSDGSGGFTTVTTNTGNTPPRDILPGEIVPSSDVRIIKLTIYI
jgi:hypothetical protein